jgi:prepilin signal peptidase PulO-like enzyme (type II secretory pathway)
VIAPPLSQATLVVLLALVGLLLGLGVNLAANSLRPAESPEEIHAHEAASTRTEPSRQFIGTTFAGLNNRRWSLLRWLLVELACAAIVPAMWLLQVESRSNLTWIPALFRTLHLLVLLLLTVTDFEQHRIPNVVVYPAIALALLAILVDPSIEDLSALVGGATGGVAFLLLYLFGWVYAALRRSSEAALGAGDVKLAAYIGLIIGWPGVTIALGLGVLAGGVAAATALLVHIARKRCHAGVSMAYGPYLALGAAVLLLLMP